MANNQPSTDSPTFTSETGMDTLFANQAQNMLSEDDKEKSRYAWDLYQKAKRWKLSWGWENGSRWWDLWRSKQWSKKRQSSFTMAVVNEIYSTLETFLGHLQDDIPDPTVSPRHPAQRPIADTVGYLLKWVDEMNEFGTDVEMPVRAAMITGMGVYRNDWDYEMDRGRGCGRYVHIDENSLMTSPWCKRLQDAEYVVEAKNVPLTFLKRNWPERAAIVPAGVWDGTLTPMRGVYGEGLGTRIGEIAAFTTTDKAQTQMSRSTISTKDKDLATLLELWIRQEDGALRYLVVANGIVLFDGPSPYSDEKYPYVIFNVIKNKDHVYGCSLVEQLENLQTLINELVSYMVDQQRYESDTPVVVKQENIEEGKVFTNAPGETLVDRSESDHGYYLLSKPGANPRWLEIINAIKEFLQQIGGNVDILRGERPAGVSTLGGMEIVREEANVLVSKMTKHIVAAIRQNYLLTVSRLGQFMKDSRMVRVTGAGNQSQYVQVNQKAGLKADGSWNVQNEIPDDFECDIDFAPEPPGGFQAKMERDLNLLKAQVVDSQFVLDDLDFDAQTVQALNQRMSQSAQAQFQQQLQLIAAQGKAKCQCSGDGAEHDPQQKMKQSVEQADPVHALKKAAQHHLMGSAA
jgi:hypothetical protein